MKKWESINNALQIMSDYIDLVIDCGDVTFQITRKPTVNGVFIILQAYTPEITVPGVLLEVVEINNSDITDARIVYYEAALLVSAMDAGALADLTTMRSVKEVYPH